MSLGVRWISGKARIRVFFLKLRKDLFSDLFDHLRRDGSRRKEGKCAVKKTLKDANPPFAHDERFGNVDASDGDRHKLRMVIGSSCLRSCLNRLTLKISFPKVAGSKVGEDAKDEAADNREDKVAGAEIPPGLKLRTPSDVLAAGTFEDSAKSEVGDIKWFPALGAIQVITDVPSDTNCGTVSELRQIGIVTHQKTRRRLTFI